MHDDGFAIDAFRDFKMLQVRKHANVAIAVGGQSRLGISWFQE